MTGGEREDEETEASQPQAASPDVSVGKASRGALRNAVFLRTGPLADKSAIRLVRYRPSPQNCSAKVS